MIATLVNTLKEWVWVNLLMGRHTAVYSDCCKIFWMHVLVAYLYGNSLSKIADDMKIIGIVCYSNI